MKNKLGVEINIETIKAKVQGDSSLHQTLLFCQKNGGDLVHRKVHLWTTVAELCKFGMELYVKQRQEGSGASWGGLSRNTVIRCFHFLERTSCGRFVVGRRGRESRFEWWVSMKELAHLCLEVAEPSTEMDEDADFVGHEYRLRPDLTIGFQLPSDLTEREAKRLADFVRTLPFGGDTEAN